VTHPEHAKQSAIVTLAGVFGMAASAVLSGARRFRTIRRFRGITTAAAGSLGGSASFFSSFFSLPSVNMGFTHACEGAKKSSTLEIKTDDMVQHMGNE
jgi:hypothetical protein